MSVLQQVLGLLPKSNERKVKQLKKKGRKTDNDKLTPLEGKGGEFPNYYVKVFRVGEDGKRTYSKIVTQEKADRLLNGFKAVTHEGKEVRVPLKRKFITLEEE